MYVCRYLCSLASLPIFIRLCTLHAKRLPCGAREKKPSTEVDKYSTGFQITITITTSDQEQINLHTPSPHSTPPIPNTKHTSQSWATEQKQPRSASATPKMPAASQSLSSNPYVFFSLSLLIALLRKTRRARLLSSSGRKQTHFMPVVGTQSADGSCNRTSWQRASSARSASRTSSRPPSDRRSRSTPPTSTARSTRTASLLPPRERMRVSRVSLRGYV